MALGLRAPDNYMGNTMCMHLVTKEGREKRGEGGGTQARSQTFRKAGGCRVSVPHHFHAKKQKPYKELSENIR